MPVVSDPGIPKSYPNQYAASAQSSGTVTVDFGFDAGLVRLVVDTGTLYVRLSTTPSTDGFKMTSGETHDFYNAGVGVRGLALASTSTAPTYRLGAWG